jgi:hypothetical protein
VDACVLEHFAVRTDEIPAQSVTINNRRRRVCEEGNELAKVPSALFAGLLLEELEQGVGGCTWRIAGVR